MKTSCLLFCLLWPVLLRADGMMQWDPENQRAILDLLVGKTNDQVAEAHQPRTFVFKAGQRKWTFDNGLLPDHIKLWQEESLRRDLHIQIAHTIKLKDGNYLIITENDLKGAPAECPGLFGMAIVKQVKENKFEEIKPLLYVAFSGTHGKTETTEIFPLAPRGLGFLMKSTDKTATGSFQNFKLFEISSEPLKLTELLSYRVQTTVQGASKVQKNVVLSPLKTGVSTEKYPDIDAHHVGKELTTDGIEKEIDDHVKITFHDGRYRIP